jgi:hypothetical protein
MWRETTLEETDVSQKVEGRNSERGGGGGSVYSARDEDLGSRYSGSVNNERDELFPVRTRSSVQSTVQEDY